MLQIQKSLAIAIADGMITGLIKFMSGYPLHAHIPDSPLAWNRVCPRETSIIQWCSQMLNACHLAVLFSLVLHSVCLCL